MYIVCVWHQVSVGCTWIWKRVWYWYRKDGQETTRLYIEIDRNTNKNTQTIIVLYDLCVCINSLVPVLLGRVRPHTRLSRLCMPVTPD